MLACMTSEMNKPGVFSISDVTVGKTAKQTLPVWTGP